MIQFQRLSAAARISVLGDILWGRACSGSGRGGRFILAAPMNTVYFSNFKQRYNHMTLIRTKFFPEKIEKVSKT